MTNLPHPDDTIVALSSAPGSGPRGIVRLAGPQTFRIVRELFTPNDPLLPPAPKRVSFGSLRLTGIAADLPAQIYFFRAPHSYTGQDLAEIHLIGSPPLLERLIADLLNRGARPAQPGEFTLRAFLAGKKDLPQAEAVLAVIEAGTNHDLQSALKQLAGGLTQPLAALRDDLLNLLADLEAALDFVEEDIEFVTQPETLRRIAAAIAHLTNLQRQLGERTVSGRPIRVVLVGEPNAGKSTLFNAMTASTAALVSPIAGTTRDYLTRTLLLQGLTLELIDTAGWQTAAGTIEAQAQQLAREQSRGADVLLWCVPATEALENRSRPEVPTAVECIVVRTKADLVVDPGSPNDREVWVTTTTSQGWQHRPALAPSQSRCRHHVEAALARLREAHAQSLYGDPPELLALTLRSALDQIGEMAGSVYTNDLLDRIFSRFCIGK
jgi:tRNA modification GTPase